MPLKRTMIGALVLAGAALPCAAAEDPFATLCESVYCREVGEIRLKVAADSLAEFTVNRKLPVYDGHFLILFAGERVYLEVEERDGVLGSIRAVPELRNEANTLVLELEQQSDKGEGLDMLLSVKNPLSLALKYNAGMALPNGDSHLKTSSCPVQPGLVAFEHWPHPIVQLLFTNFRLLAADDPKATVCEF